MSSAGKKNEKRKPGFRNLTAQEETALASVGKLRDLDPGAKLDIPENSFMLLLEGRLKALRVTRGRGMHTATLGSGDWASGAPGSSFQAETRVRVMLVDSAAALPETLLVKALQSCANVAGREARFLAQTAITLHAKTSYLSRYARNLRMQAHEESLHSDIVQSVIGRIPRLPIYVTRLITLLQDPEVEAEEVVQCARQDPSLVTELLKYVNSAALGFDTKITDVSHAVMLLGFNKVSQIVIGMGVAQTMPNSADFKEILNHSIAIAHMSYEVARLARCKQPAMISTTALLGDVGRSLLMLLKRSFERMDVFFEFFDPARIGALLLQQWNIPEEIWRGVELQNLPEFSMPAEIPEIHRQTVAVFYVARLCDEFLNGRDDQELLQGFAADYLRFLKLPENTISGLFNKHLARTLRKQPGKRVFSA